MEWTFENIYQYLIEHPNFSEFMKVFLSLNKDTQKKILNKISTGGFEALLKEGV